MMIRLIFLQINVSYFNLLILFLRKIKLNQQNRLYSHIFLLLLLIVMLYKQDK